MLQSVEAASGGRAQQFIEAERVIDMAAHDHAVNEQPDGVFDRSILAAGHGCTDQDVFLTCVSIQQYVKGCEQQHEECAALCPRELLKLFLQFDREKLCFPGAPVTR